MYLEAYVILMSFIKNIACILPSNGVVNGYHAITNDQARAEAIKTASNEAGLKIDSFIGKITKFQTFVESELLGSKLNVLILELLDYSKECSAVNNLEKIKDIQIFSKSKLEEITAEIHGLDFEFSDNNLDNFKKNIKDYLIAPDSRSVLSINIPLASCIDHELVTTTINRLI